MFFNSAAVDNVTLVFERSGNSQITFENLQSNDTHFSETHDAKQFLEKEGHIFSPAGHDHDFKNIAEKIFKASLPLEQCTEVKNGVQAYTVGEGSPVQTEEMKRQRVYHSPVKQDETWMRYVDGVDVGRYQAGWSGQYIKYGDNLSRKRRYDLFSGSRLLIRQIPGPLPYCIFACYFDSEVVNDNNSMIVKSTSAYDIKFILSVLNSRLISFWFVNHFGKLQRKIFPQFKINELRQFPIPTLESGKQRPFIEKADIMLAKNKELHDVSSKFLALLKSEFGLDKPGGKLEQWYTLDFAAFVAELTKKKIALTLAQKAEWMEHFEKQKATAAEIKSTIDATDHDIDQMVYALYGLTPEEVAIINGE